MSGRSCVPRSGHHGADADAAAVQAAALLGMASMLRGGLCGSGDATVLLWTAEGAAAYALWGPAFLISSFFFFAQSNVPPPLQLQCQAATQPLLPVQLSRWRCL